MWGFWSWYRWEEGWEEECAGGVGRGCGGGGGGVGVGSAFLEMEGLERGGDRGCVWLNGKKRVDFGWCCSRDLGGIEGNAAMMGNEAGVSGRLHMFSVSNTAADAWIDIDGM